MLHFSHVATIIVLLHLILGSALTPIEVATSVPENVKEILAKTNLTTVEELLYFNNTRRIIKGRQARNELPYMVYLKLPASSIKFQSYRRWLCGGVIVHDDYILTSAACIEDAHNFYVVSGTYKHREEDTRTNNLCMKNGAKKAIWKCVPKNYVFDGHENDNIRWMNNDIAVVKLEDEFDFTRRVRGCDFVPKPICYNNVSEELESPNRGRDLTIAGWGSLSHYNDWVNSRRTDQNSRRMDQNINQDLMRGSVDIIPKTRCKRRWGARYYNIIDNYMICTKDMIPDMSEVCNEKYVDCTDVNYSEDEEEGRRRMVVKPELLALHSAYHNHSGPSRRSLSAENMEQHSGSGGFCENDHGGPLVYGHGTEAVVIGVISACLVKERTNKCYGPFLYTSVWKNRVLIECAIFKDVAVNCNKMFRTGNTHSEITMSWVDHPDGPAKSEVKAMRRQAELRNVTLSTVIAEAKANLASTKAPKPHHIHNKKKNDTASEHGGMVFRKETNIAKLTSTKNITTDSN